MLDAASSRPAESRPLEDSLAAAGFSSTRKANQAYDHAKGVLVGLVVAQAATCTEAVDPGVVSFANGVRVLVIAAVVRTASLVDEGIRAGAHAAQAAGGAAAEVFEAAGGAAAGVFEAAGGAAAGAFEARGGAQIIAGMAGP